VGSSPSSTPHSAISEQGAVEGRASPDAAGGRHDAAGGELLPDGGTGSGGGRLADWRAYHGLASDRLRFYRSTLCAATRSICDGCGRSSRTQWALAAAGGQARGRLLGGSRDRTLDDGAMNVDVEAPVARSGVHGPPDGNAVPRAVARRGTEGSASESVRRFRDGSGRDRPHFARRCARNTGHLESGLRRNSFVCLQGRQVGEL
jgi:hypothetical protein